MNSGDELINQYIIPDPNYLGIDRALIVEAGVAVWPVISYCKSVAGDKVKTADAYEIPLPAVEAAMFYYHRHKKAIDARITLHAAIHEA